IPPRPSSPRISYLPALVAVTILFPRTDVRRLTSAFSPISPEVNAPSGLVFRSRHGRSCGQCEFSLARPTPAKPRYRASAERAIPLVRVARYQASEKLVGVTFRSRPPRCEFQRTRQPAQLE